MLVGAIGCGNVGFNTLRAFYRRGHAVCGLDPDPRAEARLRTHFGSASVLGRLSDALRTDVLFICVPTDPSLTTGAADLSILQELIDNISNLESDLDPREASPLIVQRSTCPPGTASRLSRKLHPLVYAVNPSFLSKATRWEDSDRPPKIAYGGPRKAVEILDELYADFATPSRFSTPSYEAVELLKYVENSLDAVLVSVWNEFLDLADGLGMERRDFVDVMDSLVERDRFATTLRIPGGAFGKWCLPKDLRALVQAGRSLGLPCHVLAAAETTNEEVALRRDVNHLPTRDLLEVEDGRVIASQRAREFLMPKESIAEEPDGDGESGRTTRMEGSPP